MLTPILMHGCEKWSIIEKDKLMLHMQEKKMLRKVYGPVTEESICRIGTNQKLRELHKTPDSAAHIKRRRLE
jgi:hypothetical protein